MIETLCDSAYGQIAVNCIVIVSQVAFLLALLTFKKHQIHVESLAKKLNPHDWLINHMIWGVTALTSMLAGYVIVQIIHRRSLSHVRISAGQNRLT